MGYQIFYNKKAKEDLDKLPKREAGQIVRKIGRLEQGLVGNIKRLQKHDVMYRLRMGVYRVLFDVKENAIIVQRIKHRSRAYE